VAKPYPRHRHSPGRRHATAYIEVNTRLCRACWKCVDACPKGVIGKTGFVFHKHVRIVKPGNCTGCGACVKACPNGAIEPLRQAGAPRE
jgi:2-oxoglutarate ferredoxin oxidoreductase subunit delta